MALTPKHVPLMARASNWFCNTIVSYFNFSLIPNAVDYPLFHVEIGRRDERALLGARRINEKTAF